ncbi:MAG TPA: hypothetical protein PK263_04465 [bacterium]|nr:hypothetical protein [bacterium]
MRFPFHRRPEQPSIEEREEKDEVVDFVKETIDTALKKIKTY